MGPLLGAMAACNVTVGFAPSCHIYELCNLVGSFTLNDSYPEPYLVAPPFAKAVGPGGVCKACTAAQAGANAYQFAPGGAVCGARCIPLAMPDDLVSTAPMSPADPSAGIVLTFGGGMGSRQLVHQVKCKAGAPLRPVGLVTLPYTIHWEGDVGCGKPVSPCPAAPPLAKPTTAQLRWQEMEVGALIHFNMATYGPCSTNASTFNPTKLDTDQWAQSFEAFGVKEAVLVAKHGCGFVTWPSIAKLPNGSRYGYSVAYSDWQGGAGDVLKSFKDSCLKKGMGVGYYYSLGSSQYAGRLGLTPAQLQDVELQQMTELWTTYGNNGNLTEIWFDGGFEGALEPKIKAMLAKMQPTAVAFNGCVVKGGKKQSKDTCITPNSLRWIGTEAGVAPDPNWSSGYNKGGNPRSDIFCPGESDTTLQNGDAWFYNNKPGDIRSLEELQAVYHGTVGHNSFLMMDFAPNQEGLIAPDQVARYQEFGDWQRGCYDSPASTVDKQSGRGSGMLAIVEHELGSAPNPLGREELTLKLTPPSTIDRVVLREDQTDGQMIQGWSVSAQFSTASSAIVPAAAAAAVGGWTVIANGSSVGNKWITLLAENVTGVTALKATVTSSLGPPGAAKLRSFSAHLCSRAGKASKACSLRQNWAANGVSPTVLKGKNVAECCAACEAKKSCAVFVVMPSNVPTCTLYDATSVGGKAITGAVTGSPPR